MINAFITAVSTTPEYRGEMPADLRARLSEGLPRGAGRRMSDTGTAMWGVLSAIGCAEGDPVVMISTYAETRALEEFIDSFPTPSPARFQRSVHPSAVQQARVCLAAPLRTFLPMAGGEGAILAAVRTALSIGPSAILCGGEECGTWTVPAGAGSAVGFSFALRVCREEGAAALGMLSWTESAQSGFGGGTLADFARALRERTPLCLSNPDMGAITLSWK